MGADYSDSNKGEWWIMSYTVPFYSVKQALYKALAASDIDVNFFEAATAVEDIEAYFRKQSEYCYGIFGSSTADCIPNKDLEIWDMSLDVEIYSNYRGSKVVAKALEALLNFLASDKGLEAMQEALEPFGFNIVSIKVGNLRLNLPIISDKGIWNSGATSITFRVNKK